MWLEENHDDKKVYVKSFLEVEAEHSRQVIDIFRKMAPKA